MLILFIEALEAAKDEFIISGRSTYVREGVREVVDQHEVLGDGALTLRHTSKLGEDELPVFLVVVEEIIDGGPKLMSRSIRLHDGVQDLHGD
jgi:hypothetical protein